MYFWTDKGGRRHVAYGKATHISPYDLSIGLSGKSPNSVKKNSHNGKLNPDRYKLHNQIIMSYFNGHTPYGANDKKIAYFTGGGTASGKGTFSHNISEYYSKDDNPVIIDPDDIKEKLIAADGKVMNDWNTKYYHAESKLISDRLFEISAQNNYPTLYDGTSVNFPTISSRLEYMKRLGYTTEMRFMTTDVNTVLDSSLDRYRKTGRLVSITRALDTHKSAQTTAPKLFTITDSMKLYSRKGNNVSLIATGGKGKMNIKDQKVWDNFQKQGEYDLSKDAYNAYMDKYNSIKKERGD